MTTTPPVTAEQRAAGYTVEICACPDGAYLGARKAGTPCCCERCGYMTRDQYDALLAEAREEGRQDGIRQGRVATYDEIAALVAHLRPHFTPLDVARYLAESADQLRSLLPPPADPGTDKENRDEG